MAATMVPKTSKKADSFDRDAVLERLFSLPLPPRPVGQMPGHGRPYPIHTPLGRLMRLRRMSVREIAGHEDCPNARIMSDYLAGRKEISPMHRGALARVLRVDGRVL